MQCLEYPMRIKFSSVIINYKGSLQAYSPSFQGEVFNVFTKFMFDTMPKLSGIK